MSLSQSWTLDNSNNEVTGDLHQVHLGFPGPIFIAPGESADEFTLRVTTDTQAVLDNVELLTELGSPLLQVSTGAFDTTKYPDATFLAELTVPSHRLQGIECAGEGACVIAAGTHTIEGDLSLKVSGSGSLFVSTDDISARFITVENIGAGNVQWTGKRIAAQSLRVSNTGTGAVLISSPVEIVPQVVDVQVDGKGSVLFSGKPFNVPIVTSSVTGTGNITFLPTGVCGTHNISIASKGGVYAGSLKAQNTSVTITGSGRAVIKSVNALYTNGAGDVTYVSPKPLIVESERSLFNRGPVLTTDNFYKAFASLQVPVHEPSKVGAALATEVPTTGVPEVTVPIPSFETSEPMTDSPKVSQGAGLVPSPTDAAPNDFHGLLWFVGGLGLAIIVVVVLLRRHIANKNKGYTPVK
ncbi:hypothetical protein H310_07578 [Aphanomyces invadans]|uniref:Uncharacterized protein n=1 Tax=Aphanomyces invadans TaxID=157072 RepID=A0A024U1S6_9STRA|nr:hypothetical protein H310_07578 [Aphanomyces invadans]ETW00175.1 hypothetical protein H310_07578 [Aphanomyces invadans]RHY26124.1 hypothetical protein DYB32_007854 [Aphanomyces invadans]|eukprot:XP_008871200.1 hypothetical protein H310_07578 [Aphanomyces invadans]